MRKKADAKTARSWTMSKSELSTVSAAASAGAPCGNVEKFLRLSERKLHGVAALVQQARRSPHHQAKAAPGAWGLHPENTQSRAVRRANRALADRSLTAAPDAPPTPPPPPRPESAPPAAPAQQADKRPRLTQDLSRGSGGGGSGLRPGYLRETRRAFLQALHPDGGSEAPLPPHAAARGLTSDELSRYPLYVGVRVQFETRLETLRASGKRRRALASQVRQWARQRDAKHALDHVSRNKSAAGHPRWSAHDRRTSADPAFAFASPFARGSCDAFSGSCLSPFSAKKPGNPAAAAFLPLGRAERQKGSGGGGGGCSAAKQIEESRRAYWKQAHTRAQWRAVKVRRKREELHIERQQVLEALAEGWEKTEWLASELAAQRKSQQELRWLTVVSFAARTALLQRIHEAYKERAKRVARLTRAVAIVEAVRIRTLTRRRATDPGGMGSVVGVWADRQAEKRKEARKVKELTAATAVCLHAIIGLVRCVQMRIRLARARFMARVRRIQRFARRIRWRKNLQLTIMDQQWKAEEAAVALQGRLKEIHQLRTNVEAFVKWRELEKKTPQYSTLRDVVSWKQGLPWSQRDFTLLTSLAEMKAHLLPDLDMRNMAYDIGLIPRRLFHTQSSYRRETLVEELDKRRRRFFKEITSFRKAYYAWEKEKSVLAKHITGSSSTVQAKLLELTGAKSPPARPGWTCMLSKPVLRAWIATGWDLADSVHGRSHIHCTSIVSRRSDSVDDSYPPHSGFPGAKKSRGRAAGDAKKPRAAGGTKAAANWASRTR
ncbi:hypothetical protein DIPPA_23959 [Diplonema papillatum]|nr:hypothetical protein DIPPA_23959 [Diplonema papillatum]